MSHKVELRTSRDGGRNWAATREADLGNTRDFNARVRAIRQDGKAQ